MITTADGRVHGPFDALVFASNAESAAQCLPPTLAWSAARQLLSCVQYSDKSNGGLSTGVVHSNAEAVLPPDVRDEVLSNYANYVSAKRDEQTGALAYENTFVLSSWYAGGKLKADRPRLVTYGLRRPLPALWGGEDFVVGEVHNDRNHPECSPLGLLVAMLLSRVQGQENVYFCGSFSTPGNGHDLSLCSGLAAACALGAPYPFEEDQDAKADFQRLRSIMGI